MAPPPKIALYHRAHFTEETKDAMKEPLPQPVSPSQVPEAMWQEVLPKVLKPDLNSILGSPEHLEIFLLAQQKVPMQLEKLMGSVNLLSDENIPRCDGGGRVPGAKELHLAIHGFAVWPGVSLLPLSAR